MSRTPDLSVVVVTAGRFRNVRRTLEHLRRQTARDRMEVLVVAASPELVEDKRPGELDGFAASQLVFTGAPIDNVDRAAAHGVHRASAPVVALIEDHAYPEPDWAEHVIEAHRGDWGAVGSTMVNANPKSTLSWTNLLIAYGPWTEPAFGGEQYALPGHNITYKRHLLTAYGENLKQKLGRSGGLLEDLQERGERLYLKSEARIAHANPSRIRPTIQLRFCAGRLYGAVRAAENDWTPLHRLIYIVGGPLIPAVRFARFRQELFADGQRAALIPRVFPALLFGLMLDALGQMAGYAFGPGKAPAILAVFEMDRMQHLNRSDRRLLSPPE